MTIVVDGVFFQLANTGIARVWRSVLPRLSAAAGQNVVLLDRGGLADRPTGVLVVPFPTYRPEHAPDDSALLEKVCRHYGADLFMSTYYTTPLRTPSVLAVYDMIPERFEFDLSARMWQEKEMAISHAQRHVCISNCTRNDLLEFYPELNPDRTSVAHLGVDRAVFSPQTAMQTTRIRTALGLSRDYFIFVGSRDQNKNYKNSGVFFDALRATRRADFDVLCVGGEPETPTGPRGVKVVRADLNDVELAAAYGGAAALIYPSLYEGFGLPVLEAMACRCPVITTNRAALAEIVGDAALIIDGADQREMQRALAAVRNQAKRNELALRGAEQASLFDWATFSDHLGSVIRDVIADSKSGHFDDFYAEWERLRALQASVDVC